jgi:hypothetical protein
LCLPRLTIFTVSDDWNNVSIASQKLDLELFELKTRYPVPRSHMVSISTSDMVNIRFDVAELQHDDNYLNDPSCASRPHLQLSHWLTSYSIPLSDDAVGTTGRFERCRQWIEHGWNDPAQREDVSRSAMAGFHEAMLRADKNFRDFMRQNPKPGLPSVLLQKQ